VLQATEHQDAGAPPLEKVEQQVQEAMYTEQMAPALRAYLTKLREEAYIDIKPGFVDTGASPNQTKPVFSAYAPPAPKKKTQEAKQRFDRHGAKSATATAAPQMATVELDKKGRPKKIKREKIRYGQAPRLALPAGSDDTAVAVEAAPGTAIAPVDNSNTLSAAENPLAPVAAPQKKTRFSHKAEEVKVQKTQAVQRKALDKAAATPAPASKPEVTTQKVQSAPLGLNGDTATKKKKKRAKGEAKERLQDKEPQKKAAPVQNPMPDKKTGLPPDDTRNKTAAPAPAQK
jgi:peptidyl-prolyl cis-trans isomerase SurA